MSKITLLQKYESDRSKKKKTLDVVKLYGVGLTNDATSPSVRALAQVYI